jgi:putative oxidoreductase
MFDLTPYSDYALLFMRIMVGAIFADSGYLDLKNPDERSKNLGLPKGFTLFLAVAEIAGGIAVILGVLQQLAAIGLILIMLGAIQKKISQWKTGFWGSSAPGWYYEVTLISMLLVIICTSGGKLVLFGR